MTSASMDAICAIEAASFLNPWSRSCFLDELCAPDAYQLTLILEHPPGPDTVIAYLCCRMMHDELYILKIAVRPGYRRKGIGAWFLGYCLNLPTFNRMSSVLLDVRGTNQAAIALYQRLGFQNVGKRPNYYTDTGEDGFVFRKMTKELAIDGKTGD